jgi:hypothetical protein
VAHRMHLKEWNGINQIHFSVQGYNTQVSSHKVGVRGVQKRVQHVFEHPTPFF